METENVRGSGIDSKTEKTQRYSSGSKVGNYRDNSLNRNRSAHTSKKKGASNIISPKDGENRGKDGDEISHSHREIEVNARNFHRSTSMEKNIKRNLSNDRARKGQESPRNGALGDVGGRMRDSPRRNISSERSRWGRSAPRNVSNERTRRGNASPRNASSERTKRVNYSPRNVSNERSRRVNESPRNASSERYRRGKESPRNVSGDRSSRGSVSNEGMSRGLKSPRRTVMVQKAPKGIDTSLALGDLELSDDDEDDDVYNDSDENEAVSPRKRSPRKEFGLGHLQTTKSFEAKTSSIRRRDSDETLSKSGHRHSDLIRNDIPSKPFIKKSLSNPAKIEFVRKHSIEGDDNLNDESPVKELNEQKPVLDKSLHRASSGRKLPTAPINEHLRSSNITLRKSTSDIPEKSETVVIEKSVVKENSEETIKVSGHKVLDDSIPKPKSKGTRTEEGILIEDKFSRTEAYETVDLNDNQKDTKPNETRISKDFTNSKEVPASPGEEKSTLRRSVSLEINQADKHINDVAAAAFVSKKPPSPRDCKQTKPPLEKKVSARSSSVSGVPASPRGATVPSPRNGKPPSPRGSKPPSPRNVSRTVPSPRGGSVPSPRGSLVRKSSLERISNSDKVLSRRHSSSILDSNHKDSVKRTSSAPLGNFRSPRGVSPVKGKRVTLKIDAIEVNGVDNFVDLDSLLPKGPTSVNGDENNEQARSETEVQSEKAWMDAERVWLVHKGGFASASQLKGDGLGLPEGRVKIRLDHGGEILEVDEDDVEKANPPQLDRAEDLALLRHLNESSVLHSLRQRYGGNLIHTYAGPSLIIINPMQPLQIYSEKVIQMFKGCKQEDMPPHIFASAQIAYREMLNTRQDQSVVFMGRSGSGKTYNMRHILHYLIASTPSVNNILTVEKLNAMTILIEAFGNSRTILNTTASRYSQLTTIDYDHSGQIVSASIQVLLFEKTRVVRRPEGEPTFHVFYQLLAGVDTKLRAELHLNSLTDPNLFMTPLQKAEDKQRAVQYWAKIYNAMELVQMSDDEIKSICSVLAAIYHLGVAGAVKGNNNKGQFARPAAAQRAATLLGISVEELGRNIFSSSGTATLGRSSAGRGASPADKYGDAHTSAMEALEGFVIGLYSDCFNAVVSLINRSLSSTYRSATSILVVDTPGFQNPGTCGRQSGASFEDLCFNYTQEKLQLLFHDLVFTMPQDRYSQENVECDFEFVTTSPSAMVSLIDKPSQQSLVRTSTPEVRDAEKKGLLWVLDEEAIFPGATEDSFMDRFFNYHGEQKVRRDSLLRKASSLGNTFILNHFQGTNPVQYNASGWLKVCRENPISKVATQVLQESKKSNIKDLFNSVKAPVGGMVSGSIVGMEGSTSLRRVGSMRRTFMSGTAGLKKRSMCLQVKFQVDSIIETLRKTKCHFIHCILPQANAGLCELRNPADMTNDRHEDILMNVPLVRAQVRGNEILESVRIHRQGFPDHVTFSEFIQRFEGLVPPSAQPTKDMSEKKAVVQIVEHLDIDKLNYRIGLSRVFFRAGALNRLESSRDDKVTGRITSFQAYCRGYLARKKLAKLKIYSKFFGCDLAVDFDNDVDVQVNNVGNILFISSPEPKAHKVQHLAISCIQKNVKKYSQIRDWDWWRLYIKVKPLLNVHRTEEELRDRELELEQMKTKAEKLEKERNEYKQQMDKLENRLVEITADLAEENKTATQATEMLETESAERMRLEKELKDIQGRYQSIKRNHEKLEMEMMQMRLWQAESANDGDFEEDDVDGGIYKERYEKMVRELAFTKKRLQQQHEEEIESEHNAKKGVEKRLHETLDELEDVRRQLLAAKKKNQKLLAEMQDSKLHLEEQMSHNNDLERKQRRFDSELNKFQEEARTERTMKEKLQRERDELMSEKFSLEKEVQRLKGDAESSVQKYERLQKELGDTLAHSGMKDDHELSSLKRQKAELESKVLDQEEELDDQAGQIQQLEQTKIRLEMNLEKARQQHIKDTEEKEQEMEELRYSTQKKLKTMEQQMEEEYEERKLQVAKTRELEKQLEDLKGQAAFRDKDTEKRLRRDLRRTKALLKDAELVMQKQKSSEGSRVTVRQLKSQLEDAEYASQAAIKAKKTMELELADMQQQIDELFKTKQESEDKNIGLLRDKGEIQSQLEENEEDLADIMKKYKAVVQQQSVDQITMNDQLQHIEELTTERDKLRNEVNELRSRVQVYEESSVDKIVVTRLENKIRDLEAKLDLEITTKHRLEVQINRMKEQTDRMTEEKEKIENNRQQAEEKNKQVQRQLRDLREEFSDVQKKEMELESKYKENENKVKDLESDFIQNQSDLKLAFKRIADLQAALEEDMDSDIDLSDSELDEDSGSDLDSFLPSHKRSPLVRRRGSLDSSSRGRVESASSTLTDLTENSSPRLANSHEASEA